MSQQYRVPGAATRAGFGLRLVALAVGVALALALAEVAVRVAGIGSDQFLRPDRRLGLRFIADKSGLNQGACFRAHVSTNSTGWRTREVPLAKPPGVTRVLVLGDSFVAGMQVEDDQTFASQLEAQLNEPAAGGAVEVVNLGVPSYGTDQQLVALREYGLAFQPDLVVSAFFAQNDVRNNSAALEGNGIPKPFFDLRDGELVELPISDPTPALFAFGLRMAAPFRLYPVVRQAVYQSSLLHHLAYRLGVVRFPPQEQAVAAPAATKWRWPGRWAEQLGVYEPEPSEPWRHAWAITERLLVATRDEAHRHGARYLLLGLADPVAVMPEAVRATLAADAPPLDPDAPGRQLQRIAREHDIELTSMVPEFRKRIGDSEQALNEYYLHCDGHWTRAGQALAAQVAAPPVAARLLGRPASKRESSGASLRPKGGSTLAGTQP